MTEENKYKIIKKLVETQGNKKRAALKLGCTHRLIKGYKEYGKVYFVHGNRGSKSQKAVAQKTNLFCRLADTAYGVGDSNAAPNPWLSLFLLASLLLLAIPFIPYNIAYLLVLYLVCFCNSKQKPQVLALQNLLRLVGMDAH